MNNPVDLCLSCKKASDCEGRVKQAKHPHWLIMCQSDLIPGIVIDVKEQTLAIQNGQVKAWFD